MDKKNMLAPYNMIYYRKTSVCDQKYHNIDYIPTHCTKGRDVKNKKQISKVKQSVLISAVKTLPKYGQGIFEPLQ